jgi:hypothetical protein
MLAVPTASRYANIYAYGILPSTALQPWLNLLGRYSTRGPARRGNDQKGSGGNEAPMPPAPCSPSYPGMERSCDVNLFAQEV